MYRVGLDGLRELIKYLPWLWFCTDAEPPRSRRGRPMPSIHICQSVLLFFAYQRGVRTQGWNIEAMRKMMVRPIQSLDRFFGDGVVVSTGQESLWELMDGLSDLTVGYFTFFKGKKVRGMGTTCYYIVMSMVGKILKLNLI